MSNNAKFGIRLTVLTIIISCISGFFATYPGWNFNVVLGGNLIILLVTLLSYYLLQRSLNSSNPQAFVRAMYGSFIVKFFVIAIAAFIYIQVAKENVNKTALFVCAGLYFIYTFIEVSSLTKLLREKKNA